MANFFEKLKRGMGIEGPVEEEIEKKIEKKPKKIKIPKVVDESKDSSSRFASARVRKLEIKAEPIEAEVEKSAAGKASLAPEGREEPEEKEKEELAPGPEAPVEKEVEDYNPPTTLPLAKGERAPKREKWFEPEGQLAIDIYQTENELVIRSAIAGVKPEFLDISLEREIITIKGKREKPFEEKEDYFSQECYWGPFSRELVLPVEVDPNLAEATMKEGILTIRLPKIEREKKKKIIVKG